LRPVAGFLCGVLTLLVLAGCRPTTINAQSPAPAVPAPAKRGISTGQKVMLVAGAAALYYMYKKHQKAQGEGPNGRYYRSKNGRVYYRDMKTGAYHWVDPPQQPMRVPMDEYQRVTGQPVQGYDGGVLRQAPANW